MFRGRFLSATPAVAGFLWFSMGTAVVSLRADEGCVRFDAPASVIACDVTPPDFLSGNPDERLIQLIIPVSTRVGCARQQTVPQLHIELRNIGSASQIVDYAPQTSLYSGIDGPVSVETTRETSHTLGIDASGTVGEVVKLGAKAGSGNSNGLVERYQRIPEQKLLLASGSIDRGQGVYFKFNQSPQTTLEGGHELAMTIRVPATWRGGMVRVDCRADGSEPGLFGSTDQFAAGAATFLVATWLKGDPEAQAIVNRYCDIESRLREFAKQWESRQAKQSASDPIAQLGRWMGSAPNDMPEGWADRFMLYDTRSIQSRIRPRLSRDLQRATDQYLASRASLLRLAR